MMGPPLFSPWFRTNSGNAEDVGSVSDWIYHLSKILGVSVYCYNYPGYSVTLGQIQPREYLAYEAIETTLDFVEKKEGIPASKIILFGRSLGTGPTTHLAASRKVAAVILQSPLMSAIRVVYKMPFSPIVDIFCNIDKITKVVDKGVLINNCKNVAHCEKGKVPFLSF